jgi:3-oxoacyl-[acyl-carrier protein] reductase
MIADGNLVELSGQVAIVTGASSKSGIGGAVAERLAARGARVIVTFANNAEGAQAVVASCRSAGGEAVAVQGDVSVEADCQRIVGEAERWGRIDILVNNAATRIHAGSNNLDGITPEMFMRVLAVNLMGPFLMSRAARPLLELGARLAQTPRSIIIVTSFAALSGSGSSIPYSASKAGLENMILPLARAFAPHARVNAIMPGYVDTDWFEKGAGREMRQAMVQQIRDCSPFDEVTTAAEVADALLLLCSSGARHVTGRSLLVDSGVHLAPAFRHAYTQNNV